LYKKVVNVDLTPHIAAMLYWIQFLKLN